MTPDPQLWATRILGLAILTVIIVGVTRLIWQ